MQSIEILKSQNIPFIQHLPEIENLNFPISRCAKEIAYGAMALSMVAVKAEGLEHEILRKIIENYKLDDYFSKQERLFINNLNVDIITNTQFLWRYEAYWVLLWALSFIEKLEYPDQICDVPLATSIMSNRKASKFIEDAKLRDQEEIFDQADLIYKYHWAVRNNDLKGIEISGNLDRSVIMGRHHALNWLIDSDKTDWDDIVTHT